MIDGSFAERPTSPSDRRRHDRADVNGCVVVHGPEGDVRGRIINLSVGGVLVEEVSAPCRLEVGQRVMLELETATAGWVTSAGGVRRRDDGGVAIGFAALPEPLAAAIAEEVRAADEARRAPRVVVVDPRPERRRRIADALRAAGCASLEAATPLEAVDLLERARVPVSAVAVAEATRTQTQADELVEFLAERHPHLRLALIADRPVGVIPIRGGLAVLPGDDACDPNEPVRAWLAPAP